MPRVLWVDVSAPIASFRRPLDHNYQRSLFLPPPTTLMGLAGSALGLSDVELWSDDSPLKQLKVSVATRAEHGRAIDMWSILKIKNNKITERSPYFRELLIHVSYRIVFGGSDTLLHQLKDAFLDPFYPLSLGREDELLHVHQLGFASLSGSSPVFRGTILPGDFRDMDFRWVAQGGIRSSLPMIEMLPIAFKLDQKRVRHPDQIRPFTFIPYALALEVSSLRHDAFQLDIDEQIRAEHDEQSDRMQDRMQKTGHDYELRETYVWLN